MQIAIAGTGNVGWSLVECLARNPRIDEILVLSRSQERVTALIMDIASAEPQLAEKLRFASPQEISRSAIVVLTSGYQMKAAESAQEVLKCNIEITREFLQAAVLAPDVILITLATPVDDITVYAQQKSGLAKERVFGFGGDLDRNRLEYALRRRKIKTDSIDLVGEHGRNAIPVYDGEHYDEVAEEVRLFLRTLTKLAGQPRNLATSVLLAKVIDNIILDSERTHYLCGFHSDFDIYLTWPFQLGRNGLIRPNKVRLTKSAQADLDSLVEQRRKNVMRHSVQ